MYISEKINDKASISRPQVLIYMISTLLPHPPTYPEALMVHIIINAIPTRYHSPHNFTFLQVNLICKCSYGIKRNYNIFFKVTGIQVLFSIGDTPLPLGCPVILKQKWLLTFTLLSLMLYLATLVQYTTKTLNSTLSKYVISKNCTKNANIQ